MRYVFKFFSILLLATAILGTTACGKVSAPVPLEDSGYPHSYPRH